MDSRSATLQTAVTRSGARYRRHVFAVLIAAGVLGYGSAQHTRTESSVVATGTESAGSITDDRATSYSDLLKGHQLGGNAQAIRARVDARRHRLWVLTLEHLYVYDTRTRRLLRRLSLPNWPVADFMCPPDLVLRPDGAAFVSSNVQPKLLQIVAAGFQIREHSLRLISEKQWEIGFGALAFGADGALYGLSALAGTLFRIDLSSETATEIGRSETTKGTCELAAPGGS